MYTFIKCKWFVQTVIDNYAFWVKIGHFIIETDGKRIFFYKTPPPPETKFPLRGFIYCVLTYSFTPKVLLFHGENVCTDQNTFHKKHFALKRFKIQLTLNLLNIERKLVTTMFSCTHRLLNNIFLTHIDWFQWK